MSGLRAEALHVVLGGRAVLRDVSFEPAPGWTAVVGPNGAGKSTLLRALAGLIAPASGSVRLDGRALAAVPRAERARRIAWLAQQGESTGELTARETVQLGRQPHLGLFGTPTAADEAAVDAAMAATECAAWQHRRLHALSGGECQRVMLARVLATEAPILLLDEPTTHLDPPHQVALIRLLRRLGATHTVVSVLHDLPLALHADRLLVLRAGAVQAAGTYDDPALHAALVSTFDGAVRIDSRGARPMALPHLED